MGVWVLQGGCLLVKSFVWYLRDIWAEQANCWNRLGFQKACNNSRLESSLLSARGSIYLADIEPNLMKVLHFVYLHICWKCVNIFRCASIFCFQVVTNLLILFQILSLYSFYILYILYSLHCSTVIYFKIFLLCIIDISQNQSVRYFGSVSKYQRSKYQWS